MEDTFIHKRGSNFGIGEDNGDISIHMWLLLTFEATYESMFKENLLLPILYFK